MARILQATPLLSRIPDGAAVIIIPVNFVRTPNQTWLSEISGPASNGQTGYVLDTTGMSQVRWRGSGDISSRVVGYLSSQIVLTPYHSILLRGIMFTQL